MTEVAYSHLAANPKVTELIALAAAVGSNCEACFRSHYEKARASGLATEELLHAVNVAEAVKGTSARRMSELAARKLGATPDALRGTQAAVDQALAPADDECGCGEGASAEGTTAVDTEPSCC